MVPVFVVGGDVCVCVKNFEHVIESVLFVACLGSNSQPCEEPFYWLSLSDTISRDITSLRKMLYNKMQIIAASEI